MAVMAMVRHVRVGVRVCVRGLRGGARVLRRAQGLLARRGVGVAGCHHGRRHGLLRRGKHLWRKRWLLITSSPHPPPNVSVSRFPSTAVVNTQSCTHMISRGTPSSSSCAAAVAILAGTPLCGGGVGVLALACNRGDGIEHLRGHVAWEGVDSSCQVLEEEGTC